LSNSFLQSGAWLGFTDSLFSKDLVIAEGLAQKLQLSVSDTVKVYFLSADGNERTYRKLRIAGIYKTGIEEYDKLFAFADLRLIARLNNWAPGTIGAYEIRTHDPQAAHLVLPALSAGLPEKWQALSTASIYPNLFDWLAIQDLNRNVVFVIMAVVALINLITCLLILVLERTRMIGLLKALGMSNNSLVRIFQYQATRIALLGIGWGTALGWGLAFLQEKTGWIQLDEASYYVKQAPVTIYYWQIAAVALTTALVCHLVLFLPALLVRKINVIQALRFR
jgi:lipoprotein-releasing system permease protein